jgi:ribosomal protein L44E
VETKIQHGTRTGFSYYKCRCDACKEANNAYQRNHRKQNHDKVLEIQRNWNAANKDKVNSYSRAKQKRKREVIQKIKLDSGCVDCGFNSHPEALQFDHVSGEKVKNVAALISNSTLEAAMKEIEKCEVVCANCHAIRTANRRNND